MAAPRGESRSLPPPQSPSFSPLPPPPGFEGSTCERNIDDCPNHRCQNGGVCVDGVNTYNCRCPPQWTGRAARGAPGWGRGGPWGRALPAGAPCSGPSCASSVLPRSLTCGRRCVPGGCSGLSAGLGAVAAVTGGVMDRPRGHLGKAVHGLQRSRCLINV